MDNSNYWPYTNIHELNLDWIISKVKELDTRFTDDIETFVKEYIDEHFAEWTVNANYNPNDETIIYTNGTGATLTAGDVIRFAIDNAFVNVKDPTARTAAGNAATAAGNAAAAAASAQETADSANNKIGNLADLETDDKTNIVNALNSNILHDSTWTTTGLTARKYGNVIFIRIMANVTASSNGWIEIGTVPELYRPIESEFAVGYNNALYSDSARPIRIDQDGRVFCYTPAAITNNEYRGLIIFVQ